MTMWAPSDRYPDPNVVAFDPRFKDLTIAIASIERLHTGCRFSEGPVYFGDARCVLWSDIPGNRMLRWDEETGTVTTYRRPSNHANGNTRDRQGRLLTCEHSGRRLIRTEHDGRITVLADSYRGRPLNSPNDVVVARDGAIWFTDPTFGCENPHEGHPDPAELPGSLYRIDPRTGALDMLNDSIPGLNGLAFSPDESLLYVVACRTEPRDIQVFDVIEGRRIGKGRTLIDCEGGTPDGLRVDTQGNLWCGWGMGQTERDGVRTFAPDGAPLGHIRLPERCANLCFGGLHRNRLFMAASHGLYALYVRAQGIPGA
jgi:gluconolactonase